MRRAATRAALHDDFELAVSEAHAERFRRHAEQLVAARRAAAGARTQFADLDAYLDEGDALEMMGRQLRAEHGWDERRLLRELASTPSMMQTLADALAADDPDARSRRRWLQEAMTAFWRGDRDVFAARLPQL